MNPEASPGTTGKTLLEELLCRLALLRSGAGSGDPVHVRRDLEMLLAQFEHQAHSRDKRPEAVWEAKYAICALADEILLSADAPFRLEWEKAPLQLTFFGEHLAGEGFFRRLEAFRRDPATSWEVLEVYHACLLLGFQGKYRLEDPGRLDWLVSQVGQEIVRVRGEGPAFAPHAALPSRFRAPGRGPGLPSWASGALMAGVALTILFSFKLMLKNQTREASKGGDPFSLAVAGPRP